MGQCYYVEISLRYKKAQAVAEALTKYLVEQKVLEKMPDMKTFDLKCAILKLTCDMEERHHSKDEAPAFTDTKLHYDATFDASYGYECILCGALNAIADTVEDGSFIEIWPDYGYSKFIKENGEVEEYGLDTNPTPCLYDSEDALEIMEECPGIYNVKTEDLLYTTDNISYMYAKISKSKAIELSKQSRVTQENEWLKYAAPIAKNIGEDEEACEFIDENIFGDEDEIMPERWILVTPDTIDYISVFG
ncbi:MAG: hypothetical protein J5525_12570 [Lachnospiraceae bacterium]|nr:hypothetical protein [Lachnospiraceae bacterium]